MSRAVTAGKIPLHRLMLLLFLSDPIRHSPVTLRSSSLTSLIPTSASSQPGRTHGPQFATLDSRLRLTAAFQRLSSNPRLGRAQKVRRPQPGMTHRSRGEKNSFFPSEAATLRIHHPIRCSQNQFSLLVHPTSDFKVGIRPKCVYSHSIQFLVALSSLL